MANSERYNEFYRELDDAGITFPGPSFRDDETPDFLAFLARVEANNRMHAEADLYWRTNRWEEEDQ